MWVTFHNKVSIFQPCHLKALFYIKGNIDYNFHMTYVSGWGALG